jgi:hypothetical protein
MKFRQTPPPIDEGAEEELERSVHELAGDSAPSDNAVPSETYWANLLVRTNARIDEASSGKALTISWAARVAFPGVLAILSFLIGLQYYAPHRPGREPSLQAVVLSLPGRTVDTLIIDPSQVGVPMTPAEIGIDPFELTGVEISEYLVSEGVVNEAAALFNDDQMTEVLALLSTGDK